MTQHPEGWHRVNHTHSVKVTKWRNAEFVIFGVSGLCFSTWVARVPAVRDVLHYSTGQMAVLLFGLAVGSIFGLIAAPAIYARFGARRGLRITLNGFAVSLILAAVCVQPLHSAGTLFAMLVLFGFAYSATDVLMNVDGAEVERRVGKTMLPLMQAFFSVGTLIGALIGTAAAAFAVPVLVHFSVVAALVIAAGIPSLRQLPDPAPPTPTTQERSASERTRPSMRVWTDLRLIAIGVMVIGMMFAEGTANDWLPIAAIDGHHLTNAEGTFAYGIFVVAMTLGRGFGGPLVDRYGRTRILGILAVLGIIGASCFIFTEITWLTYIGVFMWGLGASLGFPIGMSAAADHPTLGPQRVSVVSIYGYAAFLIGPPIIGVLADHFGILEALLVVAVMLVVSLIATPSVNVSRVTPTRATEPAE